MRPKLKLPPVPEPMKLETDDIQPMDEQMKKVRRRKGYESTLLTGSLIPKKNTLLGSTL